MVAPVYNWTGFYVGPNAGGAWNESKLTTSPLFSQVGYFDPTSPAAVALAARGTMRTTTMQALPIDVLIEALEDS